MTDTGHHLQFDIPVTVNQARSSRLEGLWWRLDPADRVYLIFTNVDARPLAVRSTFYIAGEAVMSGEWRLGPHACQVLDVDEVLGAVAGSVGQGGITLTYEGEPGSLLARGFVVDPARGFSSIF